VLHALLSLRFLLLLQLLLLFLAHTLPPLTHEQWFLLPKQSRCSQGSGRGWWRWRGHMDERRTFSAGH